LNFYITASKEIMARLPLEGIFSSFAFLSPEHVFNKNRSLHIELSELAKYFGIVDFHVINDLKICVN
jgi:hypothetical protein